MKLLHDSGLAEILEKEEIGIWVISAHVEYKAQGFAGDKVTIASRYKYKGGARVIIEHKMSNNKLIATSYSENVLVNLKTGKPIKPPARLLEIILRN